MIYFYYGSNREAGRIKALELSNSLLKKRPDSQRFDIGPDNNGQNAWSSNRMLELMGGQGLFSNKYIILVKNLFENEEAQDWVLNNLKEISQSANIFIFSEGKLNKPVISKLQKYCEKMVLCDGEMKDVEASGNPLNTLENKESFNIFEIAEALGERDKKRLWILYNKALDGGATAEEISGMLFWQVKSMIIASRTESADEAGMKPFPYSKAKSFCKNFKPSEMENMATDLVHLYHDSRRNGLEITLALERFILAI